MCRTKVFFFLWLIKKIKDISKLDIETKGFKLFSVPMALTFNILSEARVLPWVQGILNRFNSLVVSAHN